MPPKAKKKRPAPRTAPRMAPAMAEVMRIPLPKLGGTRPARLDVPSLTVVYGAAVVPAPEDDNDEALVRADGCEIGVLVDDSPLIEGGLVSVTEPVESRGGYAWRVRGEDPLILTPREKGVEVLVSLDPRRGDALHRPRKRKNGPDFTRWELWLYVVR